MKVQTISTLHFSADTNKPPKQDILTQFHERVKNSADMTDTIVVPRTIFKGYLGIMTGTTLVTVANLINKSKFPKMFKTIMGAGLLASMYGTYAFVRPYVIKDSKGVQTNKNIF